MNATSFSLYLSLPVLFFACSEAPSPVAEGNAKYRVSNGEGICIGSDGAVALENEEPRAPSDPGVQIRDGNSGYVIECGMSASGDTIEFEVSMQAPKNYLGKDPMFQGATSLTARGSINSEEKSGSGTVTFSTVESGSVRPDSSAPCTFVADGGGLFISYDDADEKTQNTGDMWISFSCPSVSEKRGSVDSICQSDGSINVSNCGDI